MPNTMSETTTTYETVLVARTDAVATITMNRPDRRNALNRELERDLAQALTQIRDDASVRAVVLTGAGKGFCAGADLASVPAPEFERFRKIRFFMEKAQIYSFAFV